MFTGQQFWEQAENTVLRDGSYAGGMTIPLSHSDYTTTGK